MKVRVVNPDIEMLRENIEIFRVPELKTPHGDYLDIDYFEDFLKTPYLFLAVVEDEVVGAVWGEKLKSMGFMIWGVVVKDGFRNSGIGTELLQHIEWTAYNDDCNWAVLHADNRSSKTVDFYKKMGMILDLV